MKRRVKDVSKEKEPQMLIRTAINLLVIGLNVSLDNFTLDAYLRENIYNFKYKILNNAFNITVLNFDFGSDI